MNKNICNFKVGLLALAVLISAQAFGFEGFSKPATSKALRADSDGNTSLECEVKRGKEVYQNFSVFLVEISDNKTTRVIENKIDVRVNNGSIRDANVKIVEPSVPKNPPYFFKNIKRIKFEENFRSGVISCDLTFNNLTATGDCETFFNLKTFSRAVKDAISADCKLIAQQQK